MCPLILEKILRRYRKILYRVKYRYGIEIDIKRKGIELNKTNRLFFDAKARGKIVTVYKRYFQKDICNELEFAKKCCAHQFSFLGHNVEHGEEIRWSLDPVSKTDWDHCFFYDVVYKGEGRLGDIKLPWELNKHQYFFVLGKSYWLTDEDTYCEEIIAQIDSWHRQNPIYDGINWISSLEIGMRTISWIMIYPFIEKRIDDRFLSLFTNSLYLQLEFIEQNLSRGRFANTHLIGEAASLIIGGLFLKSPKSERWVKQGIRILSEEIQNQVFADGVDKEQSLNYQRFFLDYYYLVLILLKKNSIRYPKIIDNTVEKMTEFIMYALKPDGSAPNFGDTDDARGIYVKSSCIDDFRGILSLGAVLFKRCDFKHMAGTISEEVIWLLGEEGEKTFLDITPSPPPKTSIPFKRGGYYLMRSSWDLDARYLIFDCGPLGHGPAGHGHSDSLSFQLSAHGFDYFVDTGTYSYNIDYNWRDYFRSTPAHNTITVDECNQSQIKDRMSWKTFAHSRCNLWLNTDWFDIVDGEHDGYRRIGDELLHRRIIFFIKNDCWIIADLIKSKGAHTIDYYLHLHPDASLRIDRLSRRIEVASQKDKRITVELIEDKESKLDFKIFKGDECKRLGWFSDSYGLKRPANTIRVRKDSKGDAQFFTLINVSTKDYRINLRSFNHNTVCFSIYDPEENITDTFFYSITTDCTFESDTLSFNGCLLYVKEQFERTSCIYAKDFKQLILERDMSLHSDTYVDRLEFSGGTYKITTKEDDFDLQVRNHLTNEILINGKPHIMKYGDHSQ